MSRIGSRRRIMGAEERARTAPMLYRIVHGTSATSMNLIREAAEADPDPPRLFDRAALYEAILFKYPNFTGTAQGRRRSRTGGDDRPVETGIYVPSDPSQPIEGGTGIYLRRPSHQHFLKEFFGIDVSPGNREPDPDLTKLVVLDDIPSLDPFLVKVRFDSLGIPIPAAAVRLTESEERETKAFIRQIVLPILKKAFETFGDGSEGHIERIVNSLWSPASTESVALMAAFGFDRAAAPGILFAFQGVCYYKHIFDVTHGNLKIVAGWLDGPAAAPLDLPRLAKQDRELHVMLRSAVMARLTDRLREMDDIFFKFETAIILFNRRHNPDPLRNFLQNVHRHFWRIGHVLTSLLNAVSCVEDAYGTAPGLPDVVTARETLTRLRTILSDESEMHML